jgi:hypothetical protein
MNISDAVQIAVMNQPGGITAVAARMGKSAQVLAHKLNPNNTTHQLTLTEFEQILMLTHDHTPLHSLALQLGYRLQPVGCHDDVDMSAVTSMVGMCHEHADVLSNITAAMSDGKVTALELRAFRHQLSQLLASLSQVDASMSAMEARNHGQ